MMKISRVVAPIIAALLVVGVLMVYSLQSFPAPTTTTFTRTITITGSNHTVTVSGSATTTTVAGEVKLISAAGSQAVLCTATSYVVPDTVTMTFSTSTEVVGNSTTTVTYTSAGGLTTYRESSVYVSATNSTNLAGYVVTSTSTDYNAIPSGAWTVMTCTYLP